MRTFALLCMFIMNAPGCTFQDWETLTKTSQNGEKWYLVVSVLQPEGLGRFHVISAQHFNNLAECAINERFHHIEGDHFYSQICTAAENLKYINYDDVNDRYSSKNVFQLVVEN